MDIDKPILDFLAEPENLHLAVEIAEYVGILKDQLHREFWEIYNRQMVAKIIEEDFASSWEYIPYKMSKISSRWEKCYLQPVKNLQSKHFLQVALGQATREGGYTLYRGVTWNKSPQDFAHPKYSSLVSELRTRGFSKADSNWPGWDFYPFKLEGTEFLIKMKQDKEAIVNEVLNDWWTLFLDLRPLMEEINQAIYEKP